MGYEVDSETLTYIAFQLRAGRSAMDQIADGLPDAVDAGFSSQAANAALARIGKVALALGSQGEGMADRIDVTSGAYRAAEERAENDVRLTEQELEENRERSPLKQAPEEPGGELKNRPAPVTTPAPAPTPPPLPPPSGPASPN